MSDESNDRRDGLGSALNFLVGASSAVAAIALVAGLLNFLFRPSGPEIGLRIIEVKEVETDGGTLMTCVLGGFGECEPNHPLESEQLTTIDGIEGFDPDEDRILEWVCGSGIGLPTSGGDVVCVEEAASGPTSDSFLLDDSSARVYRIDTDGDGRADLIKVGDEESKPIVEPEPWWEALLGPGVTAALLSGGFAIWTSTNRKRSDHHRDRRLAGWS